MMSGAKCCQERLLHYWDWDLGKWIKDRGVEGMCLVYYCETTFAY